MDNEIPVERDYMHPIVTSPNINELLNSLIGPGFHF